MTQTIRTTDHQIKTAIVYELGWTRIDIVGSRIALTGMVASWAARRQAEHAALSASGVTDVDNRLRVVS